MLVVSGAMAGLVPLPKVEAVPREMRVTSEQPAVSVRPGAAGRATALRTGLETFRMIGVRWADEPDGAARLRVHTDEGWGPWVPLDAEGDHAPDRGSSEDRRSGVSSQPVWVGEADGYELDVPSGAALEVALVRETGPRLRLATNEATAAETPPPIGMRSAWGARAPKSNPSYASTVRVGFVHHTVTSNTYTQAEVPSVLRSIQAFHMDSNGWDDIGYNFLVDRFGGIWEGRAGGIDRPVIGAHAQGFNSGSTGVAVLGNFTEVAPSPAAEGAVAEILGWKLPLTDVDPSGSTNVTSGGSNKYPSGTVVRLNNISGHRDAVATACPGQRLYDRLPAIRQAATLKAATIEAYPGFGGGLFVATGQFDSDAQTEIVTGADAGGGPHVRAFDNNGTPLGSFFGYGGGFRGGVRVAAGNVDAAGTDEIVTGAGPGGGPHVRMFRTNGQEVGSFFAYGTSFTGGVYVASGNVDGVPGDEIVTGAGPGGGPHVRVFNILGVELASFFPYSPAFRGGVRVATADIDGDGAAEIITAPGPGGGPHIRAFALDGRVKANFFAYVPSFTGGVYVAGVRSPNSNHDWIVTGAGEGGGPHVRSFDQSARLRAEFFAAEPAATHGVRLAGGSFRNPGDLAVAGGPGAPPVVRLRRVTGSLLVL